MALSISLHLDEYETFVEILTDKIYFEFYWIVDAFKKHCVTN